MTDQALGAALDSLGRIYQRVPLPDGMRFLIDGYALDFHYHTPAALVVAFAARAESYPLPGTQPA